MSAEGPPPPAQGPPPHWTFLTARRFDEPTAIFDMDGVLSDATDRQRFLHVDPPDWHGFNTGAAHDPPLDEGIELLRETARSHHVVVMTARPVAIRSLTVAWLATHTVPVDLLVLRPDGDDRHSPAVKRDELRRLRAQGADVRLAVDDHPGIVAMYREEGVDVRYVHSGYYEGGEV